MQIIIADDHPLFREGLASTIVRHHSFSVIGQAANGADALELITAHHPDIAILDVEMPKMSGIEVARCVHRDALPTELVLLTMHKDAVYFNAALDLGVRGFLLKDSVIGELIQCLIDVSEGRYYISPSISHFMIDREKRRETLLSNVPAIILLTPAERKILHLLADNLTSKEIARRLFISVRTAENHRLHICQKLNIKGPHKLLQFALEHKTEL